MAHQREYHKQQLLENARKASTSPGVYLMKNASNAILYVGKAKNLKNRLTSYFQPIQHEIPRIELLVAQIAEFEVILTETEAEALILENTLIKKHQPKFNVRLKDDKAYPYIKIDLNAAAPRLEWTRKVKKDGARYFGPFPSAWSARQVLYLLNETFLLRDCSDNTFRHRTRPCLLYQMERCSAPCVEKVKDFEYIGQVQQAVEVLEGNGGELISSLQAMMDEASEQKEYELAALYRDQWQNLALVTETQGVLEPDSDINRDVLDFARQDTLVHGVAMEIRKGILVSVKHFHLQNADPSYSDAELLYDFLTQLYLDGKDRRNPAPDEVLVRSCPPDPDLLERVLGVHLRVPKTKQEEQLANVARANAQHSLDLERRRLAGHGSDALEEVQSLLKLARLPHRIECYDISNLQGQQSVASRVVFIDGSPEKSLYRRYKIKTVQGQNDFAMMREVMERRFLNSSDTFPELVVVDGGKGQLAQALQILEELNVQGVETVGLAKARTESDFKEKEVKTSQERIFLPNRKNPVMLRPNTAAFRLLTHVRDEAHRFAVSYHRTLRKKKSMRS